MTMEENLFTVNHHNWIQRHTVIQVQTLKSNNYMSNTTSESINRYFYQAGCRKCKTGDLTNGKNVSRCWRKHVGTFHWSSSRGGFDTPGGTSPAAWLGLTSRVMCGWHCMVSRSQNFEAKQDNVVWMFFHSVVNVGRSMLVISVFIHLR